MANLDRSMKVPSMFLAAVVAAAPSLPVSAQATGSVVEYPDPGPGTRITEGALRLSLGGTGDVEFHRIVAILPLRSGSFIVVNGGTREFRFFDSAGRLTSRAGRGGEGPGEYANIREVALLHGDSIAVFDPGARRVSILDPQATFLRSFRLQAPFAGGGSATRMVATRDGSVLVGYSEIQRMPPRPDPVYFGQRLFRYSTSGELRAAAGIPLAESEHFVQAAPPTMGGVAYWDLAFGRVMTVRADSGGFLVGDGTEWSIEQRGLEGTVVRTHRVRRAPSALTAADKDAWSKAALAGEQGAQRLTSERMVAEMPFPKTKPAYRRFESDGAGRLWIEAYPESGQQESVWLQLDQRARTAISVTLPPRFRALAFTPQLVYGVWYDSDDVEHVRVYSLERR